MRHDTDVCLDVLFSWPLGNLNETGSRPIDNTKTAGYDSVQEASFCGILAFNCTVVKNNRNIVDLKL